MSRFLLIYIRSNSLTRKIGSGRPSKITPDILQVVEAKMQMQADDETTAVQLMDLLRQRKWSIYSPFKCETLRAKLDFS